MKDAVTVWGIDRKVVRWLESHGVKCNPLKDSSANRPEVILVGSPSGITRSKWLNLLTRIARGGSAIFLNPQVFCHDKDSTYWLPLDKKGICKVFSDWVYHKECVAKHHPIFEGLQTGGILNWDYYDQILAHEIFQGQDMPDETVCAAFAVGYNNGSIQNEGYTSGIMIGRYKLGAGCFMLNTLNILNHINQHPAADRLLLNLVAYARDCAKKTKTTLQEEIILKLLK